ncbi:histidine kinase [Bordetella genomosp. 9]|uniref:AI-2E family transporter n=1 Tax=Bordetella genomosp. 9 TaxID=1416803 RepID=UPI000A2975CE|nr:AI-2E family transporter [Bordetella genomosp. 9]ARP89278.1 histidine kinase [Bordetella genomosp. 9]
MPPRSSIDADSGPPDGAPPLDSVRFAANLVSAALIIAGLYYGRDVLIPLAFAFLISFALSPLVGWLGRLRLPRSLSVILVMAVVAVMLGGLGLLLGTQVRSLGQQLPTYQSTMQAKVAELRSSLKTPGVFDRALDTITSVRKQVESAPPPAPDGAQPVVVVPRAASPLDTARAWLAPALEPLATLGIVLVFVFISLYDRGDLRDRALRIFGGNLHRSTDALEEAGTRIGRYLRMQLLVNLSYGVPMALGLWLIGVPGALLWGTVAAVMRFVPYVGPMISAIFPIGLAFAVDPGWHMLLWTIGLIVVLELISNNVVEPLLYGTSTGLSAMSLIAAATFWTVLWGPVGLILSTPLTVCILVIGRYLPHLQFFETLLGAAPALDTPTRLYQRLIADDADEAIDIASGEVRKSSVKDFYHDVGVEVLRLASREHLRSATAEHRWRVSNGMERLLDDLREEYPPEVQSRNAMTVVCMGGKWELDNLASEMLAHALLMQGIRAESRRLPAVTARAIDNLALDDAELVCLSYFTANPAAPARHFCRRLRHRWPRLRIVLALWNAPAELLEHDAHKALGADEVVTTVNEAVLRIEAMVAPAADREEPRGEAKDESAAAPALDATGLLDGQTREELDGLAQRAADVFDVGFAVIVVISGDRELVVGQNRPLTGALPRDERDIVTMPRDEAIGRPVVAGDTTLVVPDTERDPRFVDHPAVRLWSVRFFAGAPLRSKDNGVFGALCVFDREPRTLDDTAIEVLESMAQEFAAVIAAALDEPGAAAAQDEPPSATLAQRVPE